MPQGESRDQSTMTKRGGASEGQSTETDSEIAETPANAPVIPQTVCKALWVTLVVS